MGFFAVFSILALCTGDHLIITSWWTPEGVWALISAVGVILVIVFLASNSIVERRCRMKLFELEKKGGE